MSNQQLRWSNKRSWRSSSRRRISSSRAVVERRPAIVEGGVAVGCWMSWSSSRAGVTGGASKWQQQE